jgi:hypothetical protein
VAIDRNYFLKELNLGSNKIGDKGAEALAKGLMENEDLKKLDLRSNKIGNEGARALSEALIHGKTVINTLYSKGNLIGTYEREILAKAFKRNQIANDLNFSVITAGELVKGGGSGYIPDQRFYSAPSSPTPSLAPSDQAPYEMPEIDNAESTVGKTSFGLRRRGTYANGEPGTSVKSPGATRKHVPDNSNRCLPCCIVM